MEVLHEVRHNDPIDQIRVSVTELTTPVVSAEEIIASLEVTDYYRSLSWL